MNSQKYSQQPNFPFPTKRQRRNLSKYTDLELMFHIQNIQDYWTILETELKIRSGHFKK
jgi:hypothetical protein